MTNKYHQFNDLLTDLLTNPISNGNTPTDRNITPTTKSPIDQGSNQLKQTPTYPSHYIEGVVPIGCAGSNPADRTIPQKSEIP
jgi:hypothetical protein